MEQRECENTMGSFVCRPCSEEGYTEDGPAGCKIGNPCLAGLHDCELVDYCVNHAIGEFHCMVSVWG